MQTNFTGGIIYLRLLISLEGPEPKGTTVHPTQEKPREKRGKL